MLEAWCWQSLVLVGVLIAEAAHDCVLQLRQTCLVFAALEGTVLLCTDEQTAGL